MNIPTTIVKSKNIGKVGASGPTHAKILIVGEAPGVEEVDQGRPFVGASGRELTCILRDAGINREECRLINATPYRPVNNKIETFFLGKREAKALEQEEFNGRYPTAEIYQGIDLLEKEILRVQPNVILALGATALWCLTGLEGIGHWRGSILHSRLARSEGYGYKIVATYHPAGVLRQWAWRAISVRDCQRALTESAYPEVREPLTDYQIEPTYTLAYNYLTELILQLNQCGAGTPMLLAVDIETALHKWITCIGIAVSVSQAIVIPFCLRDGSNYWTLKEEVKLIQLLKVILTHKSAHIVGQNYLYDMQYMARYWGFKSNLGFDTMLAQHTAYAGMPKALDFLSSLYLDYHCNWKSKRHGVGGDELWFYNAEDCCITYQLVPPLLDTVGKTKTGDAYETQMSLVDPVFAMEMRGIKIDEASKAKASAEIVIEIEKAKQYVEDVLGHPLNPGSNPQMKALFYDDFDMPVIFHRKTGNPTCDEDALKRFAKREPLLKPIIDNILKQRQLGVLKNTFLDAEVDPDGRMRCSYNIGGTETFRFSSSQSVFDTGTNLQNVPPPIKHLFIPDEGMMLVDVDLDRADLQVVVWEAGDEALKQAIREDVNIHEANAKDIFGTCSETQYKQAKMGVHATNYGASPRTLAIALGITVKEAEHFQKAWFGAHPGIWDWRTRVEESLQTTRMVRNRFGYRRYYFDRIESLLPQALAWIPQSTVANVINIGMRRVFDTIPEAELLLQVHDSIVFQCNVEGGKQIVDRVCEALLVTVPYVDPLIIGVGAKTSLVSWGDAK